MLAGSSNPQAAGRRSFGVLDMESGLTAARDAAGNKTGCSAADPPRDAAGMAGQRPAVPASDRLDGFKEGSGTAAARRGGGNWTPPHVRSAPTRKRHAAIPAGAKTAE